MKRRFLSREVRRLVVTRAEGRCERCRKTEQLTFHHRVPVRQGGGDEPENISYLCRDCHKEADAEIQARGRPPKPKEEQAGRHSVTLRPGQWEEARALLDRGRKETLSGVIQELLDAWMDQRRGRRADAALAEVREQLRRLEEKP